MLAGATQVGLSTVVEYLIPNFRMKSISPDESTFLAVHGFIDRSRSTACEFDSLPIAPLMPSVRRQVISVI